MIKLMVASPNNTGINNCYIANAIAYNMYLVGRAGIEASPVLTYDEHPISVARNAICRDFLEKSQATHLFMYDADTVIPPAGILRLIQDQKPIVSGWYLSRKGSGLPVVMKRLTNRALCSFSHFNDYHSLTLQDLQHLPKPLTPVDGMGAGCLLISRQALEKMKKPYFLEWNDGLEQMYVNIAEGSAQPKAVKAVINDSSNIKGHRFGEDLWFCERAAEAGVEITLDKRVFCGHWAWTILDKRYLKPEDLLPP